MHARAAIRSEGDNAERRFLQLVDTATESDAARSGDARVTVDGAQAYVEIKECHAERGKSGTINQVRPIKYICCVIWAPKHGCWYVLSADQLVRLASTKDRGQHTEIPFECMNFSLTSLPTGLHTRCDDESLSQAVFQASRRGRERDDLRALMTKLLAEIRGLGDQYRRAAAAE